MLSTLRRFPVQQPFIFGTLYSAFKGGAVDFVVQTTHEGVALKDWDTRRTALFTLFNACFAGAWQYLLFVKIMGRLCPGAAAFAAKPLAEKLRDPVGIRNVLFQNAIENGINNPLLYFPIFYSFKASLEGAENPVRTGLQMYVANAHEDIPAIWSVWVPAQLINFGFSPMWFRVPFVATVSAMWTAYVSVTRGKAPIDTGQAAPAPATTTATTPATAPSM
uniref:Uncharacterized protein n=1 Tax=Pinguiococcus pyrenoidosus TaxID=172671 RepID=A0A7R9UFH0_9STRA|mmetsp:Transcript_6293/g.24523  ORF Transcript_6293/g.24523 Transcript_6293/m.24523 type:complete len:220 (+) Transcript_6293:201-860(+)